MCTVLLPPGVYPISVKYIISYLSELLRKRLGCYFPLNRSAIYLRSNEGFESLYIFKLYYFFNFLNHIYCIFLKMNFIKYIFLVYSFLT